MFKYLKLSIIGGLSGGIFSLLSYVASLLLTNRPLYVDFLLGGLFFTVVGIGIASSLVTAIPKLAEKKKKMLYGGIVAGFLAGMFFNFGIGLYIGIIIYPIVVGLVVKLLHIPAISLRISLGGILGGIIGSIISAIFYLFWLFLQKVYPIFHDQLLIMSVVISTAIITYCMNLGLLIFAGNLCNNLKNGKG